MVDDVSEALTEYALSALLTPPDAIPEPQDFDVFWRSTFHEFGAVDVPWRQTGSTTHTATHQITQILFVSSTGEEVIAWLAIPHGETSRGLVVGHGYGGRGGPELDLVPANTAAIFPVAPGQDPNIPGRFPSLPGLHVLAGIEHHETYSHRFAAADLWRAATVLLDARPEASWRLDYTGSSFGGGIGAMALPWDTRFHRASLNVPSFGHFPIRLRRHCTGSGEAVREYLLLHPEARTVLDYFDSAISATRIHIPVHVSAAVVDPSVDPRGQFAIFHALAGPKRLTVRATGHREGPLEALSDHLSFAAAADFFALPDCHFSTTH